MNGASDWLRRRLPGLVAEHGVGAQVAVLADGEIVDAAAGVLSTGTGEKVTTGSLFQIGSITKVWTATQVERVVMPRQLLCHLGGFEGDQWFDTGTGDDCVEKFVARLAAPLGLTNVVTHYDEYRATRSRTATCPSQGRNGPSPGRCRVSTLPPVRRSP